MSGVNFRVAVVNILPVHLLYFTVSGVNLRVAVVNILSVHHHNAIFIFNFLAIHLAHSDILIK